MKPCSYMWPTSPWTRKEGQSCKKVTSVLSETIQHSAERCLCTRAAWGTGASSWKHILSSLISLFLCQMHLCWGHLHVTQSCISLCKVNQSHPSCARTTRVTVWYLGQIEKSVHYIEVWNTSSEWPFFFNLEIERFYLENKVLYVLLRSFQIDSGLWGILWGTTDWV